MKQAVKFAVSTALVLGLTATADAGTNGLDTSFGTGGVVLLGPTPNSGIKFEPRTGIAIQDDGKIVLGGRILNSSDPGAGYTLPAVGRLNHDGGWDTTFGDHGVFVLPYATAAALNGGEFHEIRILSDQTILAAGGTFTGIDGSEFNTCVLLTKLTGSGNPDVTFAADHTGSFCFDFAPNLTGSSWPFHYEGVLIGSGDSIYLTMPYTNLSHGAVAHFDSTGTLINGYGTDGMAALGDGVVATMLQPSASANGLLAVGGTNMDVRVTRFDGTGTIDMGYGTDGVAIFNSQPLVSPIQSEIDPQQRLVIADNDENEGSLPYRIARLTSSGALDAAFNGNNQQPGSPGIAQLAVSGTDADTLWAVLPLADGHLLALGESGTIPYAYPASNIALLRLNDDSSYDASFGDNTHVGWSSINVYGTASSINHARSLAADTSGHAYATIFVGDGDAQFCAGVMRVLPDRLFDGIFEDPPKMPSCPQ